VFFLLFTAVDKYFVNIICIFKWLCSLMQYFLWSWSFFSILYLLICVALLVGRSRDRFPLVSLDFSVKYSFRHYHSPGVDSAPSENKYQEYFLGVKAPGAWGWQPHHPHVPNVIKSGSLNLLKPSGPHRTSYWIPLPPFFIFAYILHVAETFLRI